MKPELRHLLNGYATGTLTEEERQRLFAAALDDQALFDALAEEQSLKDLLDDPEARGYLLAELERTPVRTEPMAAVAPVARPGSRFWLPFAGVMLALVVTGGVWWQSRRAEPAVVAVRERPPLPPSVEPAPEARGPEARAPEARAPEARVPAPARVAEVPGRREAVPVPKKEEERDAAPAQVADRGPERVAEMAAERQNEKVASAPAPGVAAGGAAGGARSNVAVAAKAPATDEVWRLENGQFVRTPPGGRFAAGETIELRLPGEEAPPRVTFGPGRLLAVERDGDGYRTEAVTLASGEQEFVITRTSEARRSRLAQPAPAAAAAPVAAGQAAAGVRRIRISVP